MSFDFQAAVAAANAVVERSQNNGNGSNSNYAYPLLYPPAGNTVVFRPLFNPASGQILRLINRHEKVACYRTYGQDCPICSVMQQVKDATGQDPFGRTKASRSRGICFAQFISSVTPIDKGNNRGNLQPGEIVLMMFPWSVYSQINTVIQAAAQTPTGMDQAFCHAQSGLYLQVSVTSDFKYTTTNVPYMTFPTQMNDDQFSDFLEKMPSLNEQVLPSAINEETQKQVSEYADAIYRQYIAPRLAQPQAPAVPTGFNQAPPAPAVTPGYNPYPNAGTPAAPQGFHPGVPYIQQSAPATFTGGYVPPVPSSTVPQTNANTAGGYTPPAPMTAPQTTPGKPDCYGHHNDGDPKCICCPCEVECMSKPF